MLTDLKELLERFANSTSFDDLTDSINQIYKDADADPELKQWFKDMDKFIRRCLQEQGYVIEEQSNQDWNALYEKGNFLLRERYKNHTNRILDEFKFLAGQFEEDPQNKAFAESMDRLFNDLGNDANGKPTFKTHLVKDLADIMLPAAFETVAYIPVPRIESSQGSIGDETNPIVVPGMAPRPDGTSQTRVELFIGTNPLYAIRDPDDRPQTPHKSIVVTGIERTTGGRPL